VASVNELILKKKGWFEPKQTKQNKTKQWPHQKLRGSIFSIFSALLRANLGKVPDVEFPVGAGRGKNSLVVWRPGKLQERILNLRKKVKEERRDAPGGLRRCATQRSGA